MKSALALLVTIVLVGCSITTVLRYDSVTIGPQALDIVLSPPLRTADRTAKHIVAVVAASRLEDLPLRVTPDLYQPYEQRRLHYRDGRVVRAQAVLTLKDGKTIRANGVATGCDSLREPCYLVFSVGVYNELLIERVSLTASAPVNLRRIEWSDSYPK